jgi:hypothetical protein
LFVDDFRVFLEEVANKTGCVGLVGFPGHGAYLVAMPAAIGSRATKRRYAIINEHEMKVSR